MFGSFNINRIIFLFIWGFIVFVRNNFDAPFVCVYDGAMCEFRNNFVFSLTPFCGDVRSCSCIFNYFYM